MIPYILNKATSLIPNPALVVQRRKSEIDTNTTKWLIAPREHDLATTILGGTRALKE